MMYGSRILHFFSTGFRAQIKIAQNITFFENSMSNFAAIRQVGSGMFSRIATDRKDEVTTSQKLCQ